MRLKSLEIKGFKSFADKTVVSFDEGITGIIGPNGCGKSNIIDSIRWVIGEQKISALRSENLEALVFNGSKTRSASGLAEVSLTFENTKNLLPTEFSTVTVTRRFYKNGESEYRLNDVTCRLKDIHNLFLCFFSFFEFSFGDLHGNCHIPVKFFNIFFGKILCAEQCHFYANIFFSFNS